MMEGRRRGPKPAGPDRFPRWDFRGDCALVSGGARGIGAAIVRRLAASGARVVFGDTDEAGGRQIEAEAGERAKYLPADFSQTGAWDRLLGEAAFRGWKPNLVVSNVGISEFRPIETLSAPDFDRLTAANQRSMWLAARESVAILRENAPSSIVFTSSVMSRFGSAGYSLYCMNKAALSGLVKSLCVELAPDRIRVNAVLPGYIQINPPHFFRRLLPRALWDEFHAAFQDHFLARAAAIQPLARPGLPEDIAEAVCFLHSPSARFISGIELPVDGGLLAQSPIPPGQGDDSQKPSPEMIAWLEQRGISLPPPRASG